MRSFFYFPATLVGGLLLRAGPLSPGVPLVTRVRDLVSIPAEISDHVMYVTVKINGHGPFRMLVDAGCSLTLVSPDVAEAVSASLEEDDEDVRAENAFGDPVDITRVMLSSVRLGAAHFEGVSAAVSDTFEKLSAIEGRKIDGALGFTFFLDVFFGLDLPKQRLLLSTRWPTDLYPIRAKLDVVEHADVSFVRAFIQGKVVELMIDTGSNEGLRLPLSAESAFSWKVKPRPGPLVATFGETAPETIGRLNGSLRLDRIEQLEPVATFSAGPSSLGLKTLQRLCVLFHQPITKSGFAARTSARTSLKLSEVLVSAFIRSRVGFGLRQLSRGVRRKARTSLPANW